MLKELVKFLDIRHRATYSLLNSEALTFIFQQNGAKIKDYKLYALNNDAEQSKALEKMKRIGISDTRSKNAPIQTSR